MHRHCIGDTELSLRCQVPGDLNRLAVVQSLKLGDCRVNGMSDPNAQQARLYERSCWSRSIKSTSLFRGRDLSNPAAFFPQIVLKAKRAAFTAASMSFRTLGNTER